MYSHKLPVLAAIPNYNRAALLPSAINPLLEQEYDGVIVLDDASTDESLDVLAGYGADVEVVRGLHNIGAGANRNRVLESQTFQKAGQAILHFIDADTVVTSARTPERIKEHIDYPNLGVMGGLVRNTSGTQFSLNFGPNLAGPLRTFKAYGTGAIQQTIEKVGDKHQELATYSRSKLDFLVKDWPNTLEPPVARNVGWVVEANMIILSGLFCMVGGFDESLRFHEIQELTRQLERRSLVCRFEPDIEAVRKEGNVQGLGRYANEFKSVAQLALRYSLPANRKPVTIG